MGLCSRIPRPQGAPTDRGSIVVGWLLRMTIALGLFALVAFDAIALGVGRMGTTDAAGSAARAAQDQWERTPDRRSVLAAADAAAAEAGVTLLADSLVVDRAGGVALTVVDDTDTMLVRLVPPLRDWAHHEVSITRPPRA